MIVMREGRSNHRVSGFASEVEDQTWGIYQKDAGRLAKVEERKPKAKFK